MPRADEFEWCPCGLLRPVHCFLALYHRIISLGIEASYDIRRRGHAPERGDPLRAQ